MPSFIGLWLNHSPCARVEDGRNPGYVAATSKFMVERPAYDSDRDLKPVGLLRVGAGNHHLLQRIYQAIAFRRSDTKLFVNLLWSFLGTGLPLLVAIVTIPRLLHAMGMARFGVLSLAWIVVGYFSLFDLGLGRAMTQLVAQKIGKGEESDIPSIVWIGMMLMTLLGVAGAIAVALISPWLVGTKLEISNDLRQETLTAFYLLAVSIPVVIGTTGLRGILEARQRFDVVNVVKFRLGS